MNARILVIGIVAAIIAVGGWAFMTGKFDGGASGPAVAQDGAANASGEDAAEAARFGPVSGDMVFGQREAPVTIIEYASMTCPHCAAFHFQTLPALKERYIDPGKVQLVFREFPLDLPALYGATLARCAGPKKFFAFIDVLFKQQPQWARAQDPVAALTQIGKLGGVSPEQFQACLDDSQIRDDILERQRLGNTVFQVNSTPSLLINGKMYAGALSIDEISKIIDPLLDE